MSAKFLLIYFLNSVSASMYIPNDPPKWSTSYSLQGEISIPYAEVSEPFTAFFDNDSSYSRIEYYNGSTYNIQLSGKGLFGTFLNIVPIKSKTGENTLKCLKMDENNEFHISLQQFLPDLSNFKMENKYLKVNTWIEKWVQVNHTKDVNTVITYVMWLYRKNNVTCPLKFEMNKFNSLFQSDFDGYSIIYKSFSPIKPHPNNFKVEDLNCKYFPGDDVDYIYSINPMMEFINKYEAYIDSSFEEFKAQYNRKYNYGTEEYFNRKKNFLQNLRYIYSKNRANNSYTLAINQFADYSKEELKSMFRAGEVNEEFNGGYPFLYNENDFKKLPSVFDWRTYGAVTAVKDQSNCGSGWSFATTGTIEGAYFLTRNERKSFSEQALIDCNWEYGNNGCDGGNSVHAFSWIKKYGLPTKNEYDQYYSEDGYCQIAKIPNGHRTKISNFVNITTFDEKALKIALVNHGPISISIHASLKSFIFYSSGVYYDQDCSNSFNELNHAALLIGYGTLYDEPYWLIKNSFSTSWGNAGYILLSQKNNNCGVLTNPIYVNL